jgi:hypothetical protein
MQYTSLRKPLLIYKCEMFTLPWGSFDYQESVRNYL